MSLEDEIHLVDEDVVRKRRKLIENLRVCRQVSHSRAWL